MLRKLKTSAAVIALIGVIVANVQVTYAALPLTASLPQSANAVARWLLDETSGTRADSIGTSTLTDNDTVASGTGISEANATSAKAADFEAGNTEWLSAGDSAPLSITGDMSFFVWINFESFPGRFNTIAGKNLLTGNQRTWLFQFDDTANELWLYTSDNGTDTDIAETAWEPSTGEWYYVGFIYDASANEVQFYVDGLAQGAADATAKASLYNSTAEFQLGSWMGSYDWYDGLMQDAILYSYELTSAQALALYNVYTQAAPSSPTGAPQQIIILSMYLKDRV